MRYLFVDQKQLCDNQNFFFLFQKWIKMNWNLDFFNVRQRFLKNWVFIGEYVEVGESEGFINF